MALKDLAKMVADAQKEKSVEEDFLNMLENTIKSENTREPYVSTKSYKPSSLGGCIRRNYFMITGTKTDKQVPSPELVGMGEIGTARHEHIQEYISKMKDYKHPVEYIDVANYVKKINKLNDDVNLKVVGKYGAEYKLHDLNRNIRFMVDGILRINNKLYIFEYKTEISYKSQSRSDIATNHKVQAGIAGIVLKIPRAIFVYENRDVCSKKPFLYEIDDKEAQTILKNINETEEFVQKNKIPPKTKHKKNCKYCPYISTCNKY
jgi:CRISPR/Cas system-associated exonuclease Cas4 (RecB family)